MHFVWQPCCSAPSSCLCATYASEPVQAPGFPVLPSVPCASPGHRGMALLASVVPRAHKGLHQAASQSSSPPVSHPFGDIQSQAGALCNLLSEALKSLLLLHCADEETKPGRGRVAFPGLRKSVWLVLGPESVLSQRLNPPASRALLARGQWCACGACPWRDGGSAAVFCRALAWSAERKEPVWPAPCSPALRQKLPGSPPSSVGRRAGTCNWRQM